MVASSSNGGSQPTAHAGRVASSPPQRGLHTSHEHIPATPPSHTQTRSRRHSHSHSHSNGMSGRARAHSSTQFQSRSRASSHGSPHAQAPAHAHVHTHSSTHRPEHSHAQNHNKLPPIKTDLLTPPAHQQMHPPARLRGRSHSHTPSSVQSHGSHTSATHNLKRAPRSPLLPRVTGAPDFSSSPRSQRPCKTLDLPGADIAVHESWGHEPPITPSCPESQQNHDRCSQMHGQLQSGVLGPDSMRPSISLAPMGPVVSMSVDPALSVALMTRPHPHSIAHPNTHTPLSLLGPAAVTPQMHGYGQPKYARIVKPDYRRFCYSVGKADVPLFPVPLTAHAGSGYTHYPGGTIRGWDAEMSSALVRRYDEWVA